MIFFAQKSFSFHITLTNPPTGDFSVPACRPHEYPVRRASFALGQEWTAAGADSAEDDYPIIDLIIKD